MTTGTSPIAVHRDDDGEILGHLVPTTTGWQPMTVFAAALAGPSDFEQAERVLRNDGMSCLADIWWVEHEPGEWREARIQEARPNRLRVWWADPMVEQSPHGQWIDPYEVKVQRHRP
ncbi:hypothetical protein [Allokutzneria sp. NRRL B-24872]|uniref:hypothetical protein n=1 Tax=Allokutzneria sp. NRRL B-24872 TaxID=1137961 RepID=UPI000A3A184A|nr:hypothetical protein [Allokutzneria sp. NRRL B-24872]